MRINLSLNFAQFSFSDHLSEASSLAGNFFLGGNMDFWNWSCHVLDFVRKTKRCSWLWGIFLVFCQSLKNDRINSKNPYPHHPYPPKNFPPKRKLLKDDQKTKIVQNLKINWYALVLGRSGASSSHKIQKTFWLFWKILEIKNSYTKMIWCLKD